MAISATALQLQLQADLDDFFNARMIEVVLDPQLIAKAAAGATRIRSDPQPDARRHDASTQSAEAIATALAAHDVLEHAGWPDVHERAASLAAALADRLTERGRTVAPRGRSTLVSWEDPDPEAARDRLAEHGILVRNLPGTPYVRASVGAWNDEGDVERLLATL